MKRRKVRQKSTDFSAERAASYSWSVCKANTKQATSNQQAELLQKVKLFMLQTASS
jgi:hypothetical protein